MNDNVTSLFGRDGPPGHPRPEHGPTRHQRMAEAAFDQVIMEGGAPDEETDAETPDRVRVRITRLEMRSPPRRPVPMPAQRLGLLRLREVPLDFYRFLFHGVGADHHWRTPPGQSDEAFYAELNGPDREVHVLYVGGAPAGFFELDVGSREAVALNCFGIMPYARGRGLARWLLNEAVMAAWAHDPPRVRLQTNSLDSPIALRLYQSIGFEVVGSTDGWLMLGEGGGAGDTRGGDTRDGDAG